MFLISIRFLKIFVLLDKSYYYVMIVIKYWVMSIGGLLMIYFLIDNYDIVNVYFMLWLFLMLIMI